MSSSSAQLNGKAGGANIGSLLDLALDLDSIYNSYTGENNHSQETLDSERDQAPIAPPSFLRFKLNQTASPPQRPQHPLHGTTPPPSSTFDRDLFDDSFGSVNGEEGDANDGNVAPPTQQQMQPPTSPYNHLELNLQSQSSGSFDFNHGALLAEKASGDTHNNSSMHVLVSTADDQDLDADVSLSQLPVVSCAEVARSQPSAPVPPPPTRTPPPAPPAHPPQPLPLQEKALDLLTANNLLAQILVILTTNDWAATKRIEDPENPDTPRIIRRAVHDFTFGKTLGEGSYSTVVLATDKHTHRKYAVKILDKRHIIKEKKVKYVNIEKHALNRLQDRIGIILLYFTFQDKHSLYFVLDYASNGELLTLIKKYGTLNEDCTRYYAVQLLDAIKFMHDNGVIHRDIKPENVLLDDRMRLQITDFGTARLLEKRSRNGGKPSDDGSDDLEDYPVDVRAKSFVGTAEYVSPELLENKYCGKPGDIWAFGCILYQMIAGKPPFKGLNEYQTFQKITKLQYAFSAGFPVVIRDLLKYILVLQPSKRATIAQIQTHYFFRSVNWNDLNLIWETAHPELGPYKMNAKSMTKVPELGKSLSLPVVPTVKRAVAPSGGAPRGQNSSKRPINKGRVSAASVAAYVLSKGGDGGALNASDDDDPPSSASTAVSSSSVSSGSVKPGKASRANSSSTVRTAVQTKPRPAADYIPGTNILRPTINSQAIRTLTSSSRSKSSQQSSSNSPSSLQSKSSRSKVMDVGRMTPLEEAWGTYLKHPDERILKIGPVICQKQPTDHFEKKHKGLIHDSPLGWYGNQNTRQTSSLLSQVVNGSTIGLRGPNVVASPDEDYDEEYAITEHYLINVPKRTPSSASTSSRDAQSKINTKSSIFKKLLKSAHHGNDEDDGDSNTSPVAHPLEKPRTCTMVITTHGRALIFLRDDDQNNYRLVTEIKLSVPFINIKEVISAGSSSKFLLRPIPSMGVFAIVSCNSTFINEVEKYDVNLWTEALARAKLNQQERENESTKEATETLTSSNVPPSSEAPNVLKSPVLASSSANISKPTTPRAGASVKEQPVHVVTSPKPTSPEVKATTNSKSSGSAYGGFLANRMSKSTKRKPPPSVYGTNTGNSSLDRTTGLGLLPGQGSDSATLHAAQLAVSNNERNRRLGDYQQRSSFSKDDVSSRTANIVKSFMPTQSHNKPAVGASNSKLLSRSQRNK